MGFVSLAVRTWYVSMGERIGDESSLRGMRGLSMPEDRRSRRKSEVVGSLPALVERASSSSEENLRSGMSTWESTGAMMAERSTMLPK